MRKKIKTFLGYLLTITMIFSNIPMITQASSEELANNATVANENAAVAMEANDSSEEPHILYELTEKRDEITKHFAMSDGSTKAYIYPQHVHYLEDEKYEEIDNTLLEHTENGKIYYKNKKNDFSVKIPESFTDDYIEFSDDNGYVKFKLLGSTNKKIEKLTKTKSLKDKDITVLQNVNDKAIFKSVKGNVDIEYDIAGNKLKETIILYKKTKNSFIFDIQTSASEAKKNNDNSISFYDAGGIELYTMESPYMIDANGEYSNAVETFLIKSANGYTLIYQPDYEWLASKDREYPVKIDPTLIQAIEKTSVTDTYVTNLQTASNPDVRGAWDVLNIGRRTQTANGSQIVLRGFIKFNLPSQIGANDCIVDAKLDLVHYTGGGTSNTGAQIDLHELTSAFDAATTWWGTQPSYEPVISDYAIVNTNNTFPSSTFSYDSYNITRLVNKWHNGGTNHGIILKLHDDVNNVSTNQQVFYFANQSTYYGSISKFVEITYRSSVGIEDYWSFHSNSTAQGTTGLVNDATGALSIVNTDMSTTGNVMPFTLTRTYNMSNYVVEPSQGIRSGIGWTTNLNQYLYWTAVSGISYCVYVDADGTSHYIRDTGNNLWYDEDGLGYKLDFYLNDYAITDKNGDCVRFTNVNGKIYPYMIQTAEGTKIDICYDSGNYDQPDRVVDGAGREIRLSYNSDGRLASVTDPAGRVTSYSYAGAGQFLEGVTYPDGKGNYFGYLHTPNGNSISAYDSDGSALIYNTNSANRVIYAYEIGTDKSPRSLFNISYPAVNVMRYTYPNGLSEDYQSDDRGRVISITNSEGYGAYTGFTTNTTSVKANNKTSFVSDVQKSVANLLLNGCAEGGDIFWDHEGWGNYSGVSASRSTDVKLGNYSWQITKESIEGIYHKRSYFEVEKGKTYTFSGYVKANLSSNGGSGGAQLYVIYHDNDGNQRKVLSEAVTTTGDNWQRVSVTFTNMQYTGLIYVFAGITEGASGTALFDCLQLEEGATMSRYNAIENGSFERDFINAQISGMVSVVNGSAPIGGGNKSAKITGNQNTNTSSSVGILNTYNIPANTNVVFSAYAKASAVPMNPAQDTYTGKQLTGNPRLFGLEVIAYYTDGTSYTQALKFNDDLTSDSWQYLSGVVNLSYQGDKNCGKTVAQISLTASYKGQANEAQFDLLSLYVEEFGTEYAYDSEGNLISSVDTASQSNTYMYGDNNLKKLISPTGSNYEYGYNTYKNVTDSTSAEGVRNIIKYNNFGTPIYTLTQGETRNKSLSDGTTYYIKNVQTGKYLQVLNNGTTSGSSVGQYTLNKTISQMWTLHANTDGSYTLSPKNAPSLYLATSGAATTSGTGAVLNAGLNNSTSFKIERTSNGNYNIKLKADTNQTLEIASAYGTDNQQVTVGTLDDKASGALDQQWYFEAVHPDDETNTTIDYRSDEPEDGSVYYIKSIHNGNYLECNAYATGQWLEQNIFTGETKQKFLIRKNGDNIRIIPVKLEKDGLETSLERTGGHLAIVGSTAENNGYYLTLSSVGNGSYKILSATNDALCLRLPDGTNTYGSTVPVSGSDSNSALSWWVFEKAGAYMESTAEYTSDGNYLTKVTASDGTSTSYVYHTTKGTLTSVAEPGNVTTNYTYDANNDLLTKVEQGDAQVLYVYSNRKLAEITTPTGTKYSFAYDNFNQRIQTSIGSRILSTNTYDNMGRLQKTTYGNGHTVETTYDILSRATLLKYNGVEKVKYTYDNDGNVSQLVDLFGNLTTNFTYDSVKRLILMTTSNGYRLRFTYDDKNRVSNMTESISGTGITNKTTDYTYDTTGIIREVRNTQGNASFSVGYEFDDLYRVNNSSVTLNDNENQAVTNTYKYKEGQLAGSTTDFIEQFTVNNKTYSYTYDVRGNITQISLNGTIIASYIYDEYDRLLTETANGMTTSWTYDLNGNILTKSLNGTTIEYKYEDSEWKDLLTSYNGQSITYDAIGNPLSIGTDTTFTWEAGRRLASITKVGVTTSFTYDASGYRTSKSSNGVTTNYYLDGDRITAMTKGSDELSFVYDEKGLIIGLYHNGVPYAYAKNLQGDIIGIIDATGNWVVTYEYDAWGVPTSVSGELASTLGQLNPFRYRGYYYDAETGFYYVSSRYYDPGIGRFISPDTTDILEVQYDLYDKNLYAYCDNNPVMRVDSSGAVWHLAVGAAVGVVTQFIADIGIGLATGSSFGEIMKSLSPVDYVSAAIGGAIAASGIGFAGAVVSNAALGGTTYLANCSYKGVEANAKDFVVSTAIGGVSGAIGGPGANGKNMRGVYSRSKQVINSTKSARKTAMYTAKVTAVKKNTAVSSVRTFAAGIFSNVSTFFRKMFTGSLT